MPQVVSRENVEHYVWGDGCDGWHLFHETDLGVIEEPMPLSTRGLRHWDHHARQFFYVLAGKMGIECDGVIYTLHPGQGLHVAPSSADQMRNDSQHLLRFPAISSPHSHGDHEPAAWQQAQP